jgi:CBS domain containing-hemolysin-like protein
MKTAISVPNNIFELSEKLAKKLKVSRSRIFAMGVEKLSEQYDEEEIIAGINRVCEKVDTSVDPVLFKMSMLSLPKDEW